jgi:hypothetical protein
MEHGILCGTRPSSAGGGSGELSHHALDNCHEGGTKSGPMGTVRFSRVVSSLLVSALHFRSAPWAFAGGCARSDQSFFLHMVEHRAFKGVDRLKGKFRSFLLASFQNHLSDAADRARRLKRGGDKDFVHLDAEDAEKRCRLEPVDFLTAEKIFDARWAMTVTRWRVDFRLRPARLKHISIGCESTTPHCCARRSAARFQIRQRLTRRFMLFVRL